MQPAKKKITSKEFASKFKSKREIYEFLTNDLLIHIPHYGKCVYYLLLTPAFASIDQITIYFLKDLLNGKKKRKYTRRQI